MKNMLSELHITVESIPGGKMVSVQTRGGLVNIRLPARRVFLVMKGVKPGASRE